MNSNNGINDIIDIEKAETSVALGMFDGVHIGHREVINSALKRDRLKPAVFTFTTLKNKENILPLKTKFDTLKKAGIKSIYSSDFESVRDLSAEDFVKEILVEKMNCKSVSCGWNFRFSKNASADANELKRICDKQGIEVEIIPPVKIDGIEVSSTRIREALKNGEIALANRMLGYNLTYELEVVEGAKLGRTLGTPTINQYIPPNCIIPRFGVYKSRVLVDVINYIAITNIGTKPTVNDGETPIMETHIPGFKMDMYGQSVAVTLCDFIRSEKKFASVDELKNQIQFDIKEVCK